MPFEVCNAKQDMEKFLENNPDCIAYAKALDIEYKLKKDILNLRECRNITQAEVAHKSGLTQQMVSRIENLEYQPRLDTLIKYLVTLGYTLEVKPLEEVSRK